ncbi:hypothetical protein F4083_02335 [Candidatus Poribacteria bacterium]|nr:hypothetical protein [Candidatus Poribacteria bacterium]MYB64530.1 hypothetical protein [Candidatus Poribacteria bacterium]MYF54929.1 hypothetical protein [Candidatus Poribacteria bacterium]MYI93148.1 hypothetical protein [Candidatus Poribacteria bacterium]
MLGYARIFKDRVFAEGKAEGKAEHHRKVLAWNRRRIQAEEQGREFTEPLPTPQETSNRPEEN